MPLIVLDADHKYWVDTVNKPGFTEIKDAMCGKSKAADFYTPEGRAEGISLHHWFNFLSQGKVPLHKPDRRIAGRVDGIKKFLYESGFVRYGGETPLYCSSLNYCVTPDGWGKIATRYCLVELKRNTVEKTHKLQTAAQKIALAEIDFRADDRYALYLRDGDYSLKLHDDPGDEHRWRAIVNGFHATRFYM